MRVEAMGVESRPKQGCLTSRRGHDERPNLSLNEANITFEGPEYEHTVAITIA